MSKNHSLIKTIITGAAAIYAANEAIDYHARDKKQCSTARGHIYEWKHGKIYYTKRGTGSPLLLIHHLDPISSGYEWSKITRRLEKNHTVYTLDLLGCGQSDKPMMTYTNFLYVQLITGFIKDIIGTSTSVITSGDSSSIALMANQWKPEIIDRTILINPKDQKKSRMETDKLHLFLKNVLSLPLIGRAIYNYYVKETHIRHIFGKYYVTKPTTDYSKILDTYYQSAHMKKSSGRFLFASIRSSYTNVDVTSAIANASNVSIIASTERKDSLKIVESYTTKNVKIDVTYISGSKYLPMLEVPEQTIKIIEHQLTSK